MKIDNLIKWKSLKKPTARSLKPRHRGRAFTNLAEEFRQLSWQRAAVHPQDQIGLMFQLNLLNWRRSGNGCRGRSACDRRRRINKCREPVAENFWGSRANMEVLSFCSGRLGTRSAPRVPRMVQPASGEACCLSQGFYWRALSLGH